MRDLTTEVVSSRRIFDVSPDIEGAIARLATAATPRPDNAADRPLCANRTFYSFDDEVPSLSLTHLYPAGVSEEISNVPATAAPASFHPYQTGLNLPRIVELFTFDPRANALGHPSTFNRIGNRFPAASCHR
jgi:hypothetical protein